MDFREGLSLAVVVVVAVVVFLAAFYVASLKPAAGKEYVVGGVRVLSEGEPRAALSAALASRELRVWIVAVNSSELVPYRQMAATEIVLGLSRLGKNVAVQGRVGGEYCVGGSATPVPCLAPDVVIQPGLADAVIILGANVTVEGSDAWMRRMAPSLRELFAWGVKDVASGSAANAGGAANG